MSFLRASSAAAVSPSAFVISKPRGRLPTILVFRGYDSDHSIIIVMNTAFEAVDHEPRSSVGIRANNSIEVPPRIRMEALLDDITWTQKVIHLRSIDASIVRSCLFSQHSCRIWHDNTQAPVLVLVSHQQGDRG